MSAFPHFVFHFNHVRFQHACVFLYTDFINLLDNYEVSTGVSETVTSEELQENRLFINAIMGTDVMKVQYSCERTDNMVIFTAAVCTACWQSVRMRNLHAGDYLENQTSGITYCCMFQSTVDALYSVTYIYHLKNGCSTVSIGVLELCCSTYRPHS